MSYLNQNLSNQDIPADNLMKESHNPSAVKYPMQREDNKWLVMYFEQGQPYPSSEIFDDFENALEFASFKLEALQLTSFEDYFEDYIF